MMLYHSFPRGSDQDGEMALKVLRNIARIGFVLTPEVITMSERLSNGEMGRQLTVGQKRICFTEIERSQLKRHSETFGAFSLSFETNTLSAAGATPVFYLPPGTERGLEGVAEALFIALGDVKNLIHELEELRQLCLNAPPEEQLVYFTIGNNAPAPALRKNVELMLSYLLHRHGQFVTMENALRGFGQLFYPTHNSRYVEELAYYRQREWRIIGDMAFCGRPLDRLLNDAEKEMLLDCNPSYFGRDVQLLDGTHRRVDQCRVYTHINGDRAMSLVSEVIVPRIYIDAATEIVRESGFQTPVIALEDAEKPEPWGRRQIANWADRMRRALRRK
ncbi:abortive infection system antitoxin AbiGi family protein [Burkholderia cepacia]|uniref:abortive infection system antitoxin AbiGi family protein n=1 Tax=Burkholderia cepacia TaxID=292 RepID=UPI002FE16CAD